MPLLSLLIVLFTTGALLYYSGAFAKPDYRRIASSIRKSAGAFLLFGIALVLTRNIGVALFAATVAYTAMSRFGFFGSELAGAGERISNVRTAFLDMSLDHANGTMTGRVLRGQFTGRNLKDLNAEALRSLLAELYASDTQSAQLLEAYLDRTSSGWRKSGAAYESRSQGYASAPMTVNEAFDVLGLRPDATREDVQAAHRNLMKRFHPDQGGSTYIALKLNEAKDILLKSVRR